MNPELGMEEWEKTFYRRMVREQEKRNASVPDYADWDLYDEGELEDD